MTSYIWQHPQWPRFSIKAEPILDPLSRARRLQGRFLQEIDSLGWDQAKEAEARALTEETVKTAAIEGEKLDPSSVRSSVSRRLGLPTAGLSRPSRAVEGLVEVLLDATLNHGKSLTTRRIKSWQAALFPTGYSGLHRVRTGQFRGAAPMRVVSGPLGHERVHFEAPPSDSLKDEMPRFIRWWEVESRGLDGLIRAAIAHLYFVTLHPFEDGNGRLARALADMALAQDEKRNQRFYSMSARILEERDLYYSVLEQTQRGGMDATPWVVWFLSCFTRAMQDSEIMLGRVLEKARFWRINSGVDLNDRQRKVLNKILDVGRDGFEGGITNRKYVGMTKTSRATAFRELSDLVEKGLLVPRLALGRSAAYDLSNTPAPPSNPGAN